MVKSRGRMQRGRLSMLREQNRYIYNHKRCGRCGGAIRSWPMAARTCYACQGCQVLPDQAALSPERSKALKAATGTKVCGLAGKGAAWAPGCAYKPADYG